MAAADLPTAGGWLDEPAGRFTGIERSVPLVGMRQSDCTSRIGSTCSTRLPVPAAPGVIGPSQSKRLRREEGLVLGHIVRTLDETLGVPFAPLDLEKIAAIDVDGAGQFHDRVGDGMNDIATQGHDVATA